MTVGGVNTARKRGKVAQENKPTDQEVLDFIVQYKIDHNGNSPTLRDIISGTSVKSTSHASWVIDKLANRDLLQVEDRGYVVKGYKYEKVSETA